MDFDRAAFNREVGRLLQHARRKKRWNQETMAAQLGIPRATYASLESGRQRISFDIVWRASVACGYPVSAFAPEPIPASSVADAKPELPRENATSSRIDELTPSRVSTLLTSGSSGKSVGDLGR